MVNKIIEQYVTIPERADILAYLTQLNRPASKQTIADYFNLLLATEQEALHRRLRAMERDGQLIFTSKKCYALVEKLDLVKGTIIAHRDGYGFLDMEGEKQDLYLSMDEMKKVIHGDVVLAQPLSHDKYNRSQVRIVRVLEPMQLTIIGRYFFNDGIGFVVPNDTRFNFDIYIANENALDAKSDDVVAVTLLERPAKNINAIGKITEVFGNILSTEMAINTTLRSHNIPYTWPEDVEQQASYFTHTIAEHDKHDRKDLTQLPFVTIDGEDAKDFDDAVFCQKNRGGGWRLWVAIADVSYYVTPGSAIDKEALKRGTSVYFPIKVIPMLPETLSNGLCSLNPQIDRLCLVCEMTLSRVGQLTSYQFYEAIINSKARLTYTNVAKIFDGDTELQLKYQPLVPHLTQLHELYKTLAAARDTRGSIAFETAEAKFILDEAQHIEQIERLERNDAHKLIEEFMILANVAAAKFVEKQQMPALYRIHELPKEDNLLKLRSQLAVMGLTLGGGLMPKPKDYAKLLQHVAAQPNKEMVQTILLRSMKQAIYYPENKAHFGLNLSSYAHFTSPIRRYPDLLLHRVIKYLIKNGNNVKTKKTTKTGGYYYSFPEMLYFGEHCSMTERRADEASGDVINWLKCDFMKNHLGEQFSGKITNVVSFGFFVRLDELFIDGLVHVSSLENDYYQFDPVSQRLIGESSGQVYRLGDSVDIRVDAVNMEEKKIDFSLLSTSKKIRGKLKKVKSSKSVDSSSKAVTKLKKQKSRTNKVVKTKTDSSLMAKRKR